MNGVQKKNLIDTLTASNTKTVVEEHASSENVPTSFCDSIDNHDEVAI